MRGMNPQITNISVKNECVAVDMRFMEILHVALLFCSCWMHNNAFDGNE